PGFSATATRFAFAPRLRCVARAQRSDSQSLRKRPPPPLPCCAGEARRPVAAGAWAIGKTKAGRAPALGDRYQTRSRRGGPGLADPGLAFPAEIEPWLYS